MLNKKVLAAAIVGSLFAAGNAAAANLSANPVVPAYFAKEIVATPAAPRTLTTSASAATQLTWNIGYNFSQDEVRYVRVECSNNIRFAGATTVALSDAAAGNVGAVNGLGTNVLTFSITSVGGPGNNVIGTDTLLVSGNHAITGTDSNVNCSVGMYDQPSQAQAGGSTGLIANTSFSGPYIVFAPSYELVADATTHTANVEATPSFSDFLADANTTVATASLANGSIAYRLRDPDGGGAQSAPFRVDGTAITLADLFAAATRIEVAGDYALAANAAAPLYTGAALGRVQLNGANANTLNATTASFTVGSTGFATADFDLTRRAGVLIPAAAYTASLRVAAADATTYSVTDITGVSFGSIVRNGTELQAPLVQVPSGWLARIALTNTGSAARPYTISVLTETGATFEIASSKLSGTVPANGTQVIQLSDEDLDLAGGSGRRGTLVVNVAGPTNQVQGLYQVVNPTNGLITNHVMVRPGSN
ncbi:hypothetical protein [Pseudoxanthomonas mexicana]|uniref:hypothetical protein n=1 Tax=Pseudoxanthomonas mexicana TaxID=128785 RepID=UPI00398BAE50